MDYSNVISALSLFGALIFFLIVGVPIGFALLIAGIGGLVITQSLTSVSYLLATYPYSQAAELTFIVLPLFLLMGNLCLSAGIARRAFDTARVWVGSIPGGLAIANVFACAGFGAVSGSSLATTVTMGRFSVPLMLKEGYSQPLATGTVANAGTLASLIPPSGLLIIYGITTQTSIIDLFIAGLIPGILTAISFALTIYCWVKLFPQSGPSESDLRRYTYREKAKATLKSWEIVLLFLVVMGSIYGGLATATEAAAIGATMSILIVLFRNRKHAGKVIIDGLAESGVATSTIFLLIIGAGLFGLALGTTRFPQEISALLVSLDLSAWQKTLVLLIPFLILGCFIDGLTMILLIMPIIQPALVEADINLVLFGILVVKCTEIGTVTPPVGLNCYAVQTVARGLKLEKIFKGAVVFIIADLVIIGVLVAFNEVALFLVD